MEASPSKGLFSCCIESWEERGSPRPEATVRQSSPAASIEQKFSVVVEDPESQELADAHSSAGRCPFAAGTDERASSQSSGGRARSEELDSSSVRGKRAASASGSAAAGDSAEQDQPLAPVPCVHTL